VDRVGRYQILEELGRGAMGVVYKALDPAIGRTVAIKTIRLGDLPDPEERKRVRARLLREAQSAGILSHPNIVTIYDVLEEPEFAYVVMEYVSGKSLEAMLRERTLPEKSALLHFLRQVSDALDYAHHKGIVHRDIKPANIIISEPAPGFDPLAKVTDFGVAKFVSQEVTHSGTMIGTPNYMSPEQIQGLTVDGRSDQFSLAVMIFELLSGEKPFEGENLPALFYQICRQDPKPIEQLNPTLSPTVGKVLGRALAKEPNERFVSCGDLMGALSIALGECPDWTPAALPVAGAGSAAKSRATTAAAASATDGGTQTGGGVAVAAAVSRVEAPPARPVPELPSLSRRRHDVWEEKDRGLEEESKSRGGKVLLLAAICAVIAALILLAVRWKPSPAVPIQTSAPAPGAVTTPPPAETLTPPTVREQNAPSSAPAQMAAPQEAKPTPPVARSKEAETSPATLPQPPALPARASETLPARASEPMQNATAAVDLLSEPPGAKMVVDDNPQTSCLSPCTLSLKNGRHTLAVEMNGYETARRIFNVPDETSLYVPLVKNMGVLVVTSSPPGSSIFIDGRNYGHTPSTIRVPPGLHRIELVNGPLRQQQMIQVESGAFIPVTIRWGQQSQ